MASLLITPITPFPVKTQESTTVNNIVYNIKNISGSASTLALKGLNGGGINGSLNAVNLADGASCQLTISFSAPALQEGLDSKPLTRFFTISSGGSKSDTPYILSSLITKGGGTGLTITVDIKFDTIATTSDTFTLTLTDLKTSTPQVFNDLPFGQSTLPSLIQPDQYSVYITPTDVEGSDAEDYYAPVIFNVYLNTHNTNIPIEYNKQQSIAVKTNITAPNLSGDVTIEMLGAATSYSHDQAAGETPYDNVQLGKYTVTAASYVGTDTKNYVATLNNPYTISSTSDVVNIVYEEQPVKGNFPWSDTTRLENEIKPAGVGGIIGGGGSTTAPVQISTNPPINPWLNSTVNVYTASPIAVKEGLPLPPHFPAYIGFGTVSDQTTTTNEQLYALLMDWINHYEGDGAGNTGQFCDGPDGYTSIAKAMKDQLAAVKLVNGHFCIGMIDLYTINASNGPTAVLADVTVDSNLIPHIYNLAVLAKILQGFYDSTGIAMGIFLNPDLVGIFQGCTQYYCPNKWQSGLTDPSEKTPIIQIPNLRADIVAAFDRMVTMGHLTSEQVTTLLADLDSSNILVPPVGLGRATAGLPELITVYSWLMRSLSTDVPFGYGFNLYDNSNPLMNPSTPTPPVDPSNFQVGSITWIHKVRSLKLSPTQLQEAIAFQAQKLYQFCQQMNLVGDSNGNYKPHFIYFDRYERDVIPSEVAPGYLMNGPDMKVVIAYSRAFHELCGLPIYFWQYACSSLQKDGATFVGVLCDTLMNYIFGNPEIQDDLSNVSPLLNLESQVLSEDDKERTYFINDKNINTVADYIREPVEE
jgi:hypothetical protein